MKEYIGIVKPNILQQLIDAACGTNIIYVGTDTTRDDNPHYIEYDNNISSEVLEKVKSIINTEVNFYLTSIKTKMVDRIIQVAAKSVTRRGFDPNIDINAQQASTWLNNLESEVPSCVLSFSLANNCDNYQAANQIIAQQTEYRKYLNDVAAIKQQTLDNIAAQQEYRKVKLVTQDGILALAEIEKL